MRPTCIFPTVRACVYEFICVLNSFFLVRLPLCLYVCFRPILHKLRLRCTFRSELSPRIISVYVLLSYPPNLVEEEDIDLYKKALKDAEKDPLTPGWYSSQAPSALPVAGKKFSSLDEAKSYYGDAKRQRENKIDHSKPKPWRRKADGDWWRSEHAQTIRIAASYNHQWSSQAKSMGRP